MDYMKSGDWELGVAIKRREWVEGTEIVYQRSDIGVGTGSNSISPLRLSPQGCKVTCHGVDDCQGPICHMGIAEANESICAEANTRRVGGSN